MYYNKDDISMYYEKYGDGNKSIVILPGWGDTRRTFQFMINYLKNNYTVYIFDYPGFGKSIFPDRDLTIYDYTNIIRDFIKNENINKPIIIAHSFGGRIATLMAGYYKDKIDKLIMIDTAGIKSFKGPIKLLKQYIYKLLKKLSIFIPKRKRNLYLKKLIKIFGSKDYKNLNNNMYNSFKNIVNEDLKYYIANIPTTTLIIWGKLDYDTPLRYSKYLHKKIRKSSLVILPTAGHFSYLDYPTFTNKLISDFLELK